LERDLIGFSYDTQICVFFLYPFILALYIDIHLYIFANLYFDNLILNTWCFQALQQQQKGEASGDFQEFGPDGKTNTKRKFAMDAALEDKICDLYDLFVDVWISSIDIYLEILGCDKAFLFNLACDCCRGWMKTQVHRSESCMLRWFKFSKSSSQCCFFKQLGCLHCIFCAEDEKVKSTWFLCLYMIKMFAIFCLENLLVL